MDIATRVLARQLTAALPLIAAKTANPVLKAWADAERITTAADNLGIPDTMLTAQVHQALKAGVDPAATADVQRLVTMSAIANEGIRRGVAGLALDEFASALAQHQDGIVAGWQAVFGKAAAELTAAHNRIGDIPLEDSGTILRAGGDIAAVWAKAQDASALIEQIDTGWVALGTLTRTINANPDYRVLRRAAADYGTWTDMHLHRAKLSPWACLLTGLDLALPTYAEYRTRVKAIQDGNTAASMSQAIDPDRATARAAAADWAARTRVPAA